MAYLVFLIPIRSQIGTFTLPNAGLEVVQMNPAKVALTEGDWSVNLFSVSAEMQTNHSYLYNESFLHLGKQLTQKGSIEDRVSTYISPKFEYYDREHATFGKVHTRVAGPSFSIKYKDWQLGLMMGVNLSVSATSIPKPLGYYNNYEIPIGREYSLEKGQSAALMWSDVGLHVSRSFRIHHNKQIYFGANFKYLTSYYALGVKNTGTSVVKKLGGSRVAAISGEGKLVLSDGWQYNTPFEFQKTGAGYGMDVGFIMRSRASHHAPTIEWGVSINDLGFLNLNSDVTHSADIDVDNETTFNMSPFEEVGYHPQSSRRIFSDIIANEENTVLADKGSVFYTPARVFSHLKLPVGRNFLGQIVWQQSLIFDYRTPSSMNYISIAPAYRHRQFSVSLPVSWMNYDQVWTGLTIKYGPLTVGTDRLFGTVFSKRRMDGAAFYLGLKLDAATFPFKTAWWPRQKEKCPEF